MFNWFSNSKQQRNETLVKPNKANLRLDSYITEHEEDDYKEDHVHRDHLIFTHKSNNSEQLIHHRDRIIQKNIEATIKAEQELSNDYSPIRRVIPIPRESCHELDFTEADMETVLKNLEDDPFADTSEILEESIGKKVVEVSVIFTDDNTLGERTYAFPTKSYTSFYEDWAEQLQNFDSFTSYDINGDRVTIHSNKCYSIRMKECYY